MSETYPLYCLDNGDPRDERQFRGPFLNEQAARDAMARAEPQTFQLRRCRRVRPSEVVTLYAAEHLVEWLEESMDEQLAESGDAPVGSWADWDDSLVGRQIGGKGAAAEAMRGFLDRMFRTRIYVCEPDEPKSGGQADGA